MTTHGAAWDEELGGDRTDNSLFSFPEGKFHAATRKAWAWTKSGSHAPDRWTIPSWCVEALFEHAPFKNTTEDNTVKVTTHTLGLREFIEGALEALRHASGAALSEAQKINASLHSLGLVISALARESMLLYNGCTATRTMRAPLSCANPPSWNCERMVYGIMSPAGATPDRRLCIALCRLTRPSSAHGRSGRLRRQLTSAWREVLRNLTSNVDSA
mgnify:CR=1 FL=1